MKGSHSPRVSTNSWLVIGPLAPTAPVCRGEERLAIVQIASQLRPAEVRPADPDQLGVTERRQPAVRGSRICRP
jgi:hypothetical protein